LSQYAVEAVAATGATRGFIALAQRETGGLEVVATAGDGWTEAARRDRLCRRCVNGGTITLQVASTGRAVRVDDVTLDDATLDASYQPFFEGVRSVLAVPIAQGPEARVRGVINLESDVPGEFTPDEEAFVAVLADLAALRLEMEDMNAREAALVRIGKDLSIAADADALMKKVADVAAEILHFEDCSIFLIDKASRRLMLVATRGPLAPQIGRASYAPGEGLTGWVAEHGTSIRLGDPREDRRHRGLHQEFPSEQVGAFLAVPIRSHTGIVGVLRVLRKSPPRPGSRTCSPRKTSRCWPRSRPRSARRSTTPSCSRSWCRPSGWRCGARCRR
jgi:GAF domain-containing protein